MTDVIRSQLWYRGDAAELSQFFRQLNLGTNSFWSSVPENEKDTQDTQWSACIIADTLSYIVYSDMDDIKVTGDKAKADFDNISGAYRLHRADRQGDSYRTC